MYKKRSANQQNCERSIMWKLDSLWIALIKIIVKNTIKTLKMFAITHYDPNTLYILRFSGEVDIRIRSSHFKGIIKNKYFGEGKSFTWT